MKRRKFDQALKSVSELLRALAHPERIRLVGLLHQYEEMDVSQLHEATGISQSLVSQHLKLLKSQGVVIERREGKHVFYHLRNPLIKGVITSAIEFEAKAGVFVDPESVAILSELRSLWNERNSSLEEKNEELVSGL